MKQFLDFIPLILFFACFKILGIYPATALLLISTVVIYGGIWLHSRKLDQTQSITLAATLLFGSLTLAFHSDTFIKLKAPLVSYITALFFLGSHVVGRTLLVERLLGHVFAMPAALWKRLNLAWVVYFIILGSTNLYIAFHFPTHWVTFKVFGSLLMTLTFMSAQVILLRHYLIKSPHGEA